MMRDKLMRVIHDTVDPYLEGYGGSQVPKLADAILFAFDVKPLIEKHRLCSCGSQFKIEKDHENFNHWLLICENLGCCCEVVCVHVKTKTQDEAWAVWDGVK